jgi:hypothetical protein
MASTSFFARSRGDKDVSCQANVVSDKVGPPQWALPYSLNIESGLHDRSCGCSAARQTDARQQELVPQPGVATSGDAAREVLELFLAIGLPSTMNVRNVSVSGDIALVIADWSLKGGGADGSDVDMSGSTADVARRGADGWEVRC